MLCGKEESNSMAFVCFTENKPAGNRSSISLHRAVLHRETPAPASLFVKPVS